VHVSATSADMRYTGSMPNAFVQSMDHNFEQALRLMEAALADCPDDLWQTDLWPDEAPTGPAPHGGLHGSAPWFLGYHALNTLTMTWLPSSSRGRRRNRLTTTPTASPTAGSLGPSFSGTSIGAAAGYARPLTASLRRRPLGHFLAPIDTTARCTE
jgi:hypothetical protein